MENLFEHVEFGLVVDQYDQNYCMDPIRISNTMTVKWHLKVKVRLRIYAYILTLFFEGGRYGWIHLDNAYELMA